MIDGNDIQDDADDVVTAKSKPKINSTIQLPEGKSIDANLMFMKLVIVFRAFNKEYIFLPEMYLPSLAKSRSISSRSQYGYGTGYESKAKTLPLICHALYFNDKTFTSNDKKLAAQGFTYPTLKILLEGTKKYAKLKYLIRHLSTKWGVTSSTLSRMKTYNNIKLMEEYLEMLNRGDENDNALDMLTKKKMFLQTFWVQHFQKIVELNIQSLLALFFKTGQVISVEPNKKLKVDSYHWDGIPIIGSIRQSKNAPDRSRLEDLYHHQIQKKNKVDDYFRRVILEDREKKCSDFEYKGEEGKVRHDMYSRRRNGVLSQEFHRKYGNKPAHMPWDDYLTVLYKEVDKTYVEAYRELFCKQLQKYDAATKEEKTKKRVEEDMIFCYVDITFSAVDKKEAKTDKTSTKKTTSWFDKAKCMTKFEELKRNAELLFIDQSNDAFKDSVISFSTPLIQKAVQEPDWLAEIRQKKKIVLNNASAYYPSQSSSSSSSSSSPKTIRQGGRRQQHRRTRKQVLARS